MISSILKNNLMLMIMFFITTSFNHPLKTFSFIGYDYSSYEYEVSDDLEEELTNFIFLKKDFVGFKELLAFKESTGNYSIINKDMVTGVSLIVVFHLSISYIQKKRKKK